MSIFIDPNETFEIKINFFKIENEISSEFWFMKRRINVRSIQGRIYLMGIVSYSENARIKNFVSKLGNVSQVFTFFDLVEDLNKRLDPWFQASVNNNLIFSFVSCPFEHFNLFDNSNTLNILNDLKQKKVIQYLSTFVE